MPSRRSRRNPQQQVHRYSQRHPQRNRRLPAQWHAPERSFMYDTLPEETHPTANHQQSWPQTEALQGSGPNSHLPSAQQGQTQNQQQQQQQQQSQSQQPFQSGTMTLQEARQIATNQVVGMFQRHTDIERYMVYLQQSTEQLRQAMWEAQQREMSRNRQWLRPPVWALHPELPDGA